MKRHSSIKSKAILNPPIIAMIVANIIPIAGVLWYDWDAAIIMSLYWTETLIIGFYALLRIISAPLKRISLKKRLGGICFFLLFFGWFCSGHGVAVVFLFFIYPHMKSDASWIPPAVPEDIYKPSWPGPLALYELGTDTIKLLYYLLPRTAIIMILSLIFSHGISFVLDYLIKGNRNTANLRELIAEPFARVIILHISVMIGGFVICVFKTNVVVLICLLLFKCCLDVSMYIRRQIKKVPNDEIEMLDGQRPK